MKFIALGLVLYAGLVTASDKIFAPESCPGPTITTEQVLSLIPGDTDSVWLASSGTSEASHPIHVRRRNCLGGTCGPWKYNREGSIRASIKIDGEHAKLTLFMGYQDGYSTFCAADCGDVRSGMISCSEFRRGGSRCWMNESKVVGQLVGRMTGGCLQLVSQTGRPVIREAGVLIRFAESRPQK